MQEEARKVEAEMESALAAKQVAESEMKKVLTLILSSKVCDFFKAEVEFQAALAVQEKEVKKEMSSCIREALKNKKIMQQAVSFSISGKHLSREVSRTGSPNERRKPRCFQNE